MKFLALTLGLAPIASAHTLFSTLFINGENQGDGTCIRMPQDGATSTAPIYPLTGEVMACGRDGQDAVPFVCPASGGSTLTFNFRSWPNNEVPGSIDPSHKGPCAVYLKKMDDISDPAAGPGWFKIWDDGYNADTGKWCVDTLIENDGFLSVSLPSGLPAGYYLARPELLALHSAPSGDPQFYHNCAQIFIENGPEGSLNIPSEYEVSIPGHVQASDPGLTFNLYTEDAATYQIPGPKVYVPKSSGTGTRRTLEDGAIPDNCILKNGNWCAKPVGAYNDQTTCWEGVENCWAQSKTCWDTMQPSGGYNCEVWGDYCTSMGESCEAGDYNGPPEFTGQEVFANPTDSVPEPYNVPEGVNVTPTKPTEPAPEPVEEETPSEPAPTASATAVPVPEDDTPTEEEPPKEEEDTGSDGGDAPVELKISKDGRCGGTTGQTCLGSAFGDCCSKKGKCGRKTRHCTCGCQSAFGKCRD